MALTGAERARKFRAEKKELRLEKELLGLQTVVFGGLPPQSMDMEEYILGCILSDQNCIFTVLEIFGNSNPFYKELHQVVYNCALNLFEKMMKGEVVAIDVFLVYEEYKGLPPEQKLPDMDNINPSLLLEMTGCVGNTNNLTAHAKIVFNMYQSRILINLGAELSKFAYQNDPISAINLINSYNENIKSYAGVKTMHDKIISIAKINIPESFLGGLIPSLAITILFAPAGTGKSALIITLANCIATGDTFFRWKSDPMKVLIIDYELTDVDYKDRYGTSDFFHKKQIYIECKPTSFIEVKQKIGLLKPNFLILDNITMMIDTLNNKAIEEVFEYFQNLQKSCTILIIGHTPKGAFDRILETKDMSGLTALVNKVSGLVSINKNPNNSNEIYLKSHKNRRKPNSLVFDNNVLVMEKINENGVFLIKPSYLIDERLLWCNSERIMQSYNIVMTAKEKGKSDLAIMKDYNLTEEKLDKILILGKMITANNVKNYNDYSNPYLDDAWDSLIHSSNEQIYA